MPFTQGIRALVHSERPHKAKQDSLALKCSCSTSSELITPPWSESLAKQRGPVPAEGQHYFFRNILLTHTRSSFRRSYCTGKLRSQSVSQCNSFLQQEVKQDDQAAIMRHFQYCYLTANCSEEIRKRLFITSVTLLWLFKSKWKV